MKEQIIIGLFLLCAFGMVAFLAVPIVLHELAVILNFWF